MISWIAANRSKVGLAVVSTADPSRPVIELNAHALFPLASTKKILILGAYATDVVDGLLNLDQPVFLSAINRFYWPGTDGGAHTNAVRDWSVRDRIFGAGDDRAVALSDVAWAMIRWSDNAAADYLLSRVGPDAVSRFVRSAGLSDQQPVWPIFGEFVAWAKEPRAWLEMTRASVPPPQTDWPEAPLRPRRRLSGLPSRNNWRSRGPTPPADPLRGRLMLEIGDGSGRHIPTAVTALMIEDLEWPLTFPSNQAAFSAFDDKGGSLAGSSPRPPTSGRRGQPRDTRSPCSSRTSTTPPGRP
jgi:D-alanyl-D-alanine carboxypeptidase